MIRGPLSDQTFAMKGQPTKFFVENPLYVECFENEVATHKTVKSPFLISLIFGFKTASRVYLIFDYCSGSDLETFIRKRNVTEDMIRFVMAEFSMGLLHLHAYGIVHRDLKPNNILLTSEGHVKIADYGMSKNIGTGRTYSIKGAYEYMAPEITFISRNGHGKKADWWSFGIVFYKMFTGRLPFSHPDEDELLKLLKKGDYATANLSETSISIIEKFLEKDEDLRIDGLQMRSHDFFSGINWEDIEHGKHAVPMEMRTGYENFEEVVAKYHPLEEDDIFTLPSNHEDLFKNFYYDSTLES